jgi:hypothetical protein
MVQYPAPRLVPKLESAVPQRTLKTTQTLWLAHRECQLDVLQTQRQEKTQAPLPATTLAVRQ